MFKHFRFSVRMGRAIRFLLLISVFHAAPADLQAGELLSLVDLIREIEARNPELAAAGSALEAAENRVPFAGALPDPMLTVVVQNVGSAYSVGREEMSMAGVSVSQMFPFPGKRTLGREAARLEASQMAAVREETRQRVLYEAKRLYFELAMVRGSQAILIDMEFLLRVVTETAEARYGVGEGQQQDLLRAQTERIRLTDRRIRLDQQEKLLKAAINALMLNPPNAPLGDPIPIRTPLPKYTAPEIEAAAMARAPMILASDRNVAAKEKILERARRERFPDFELSLGYFDRGGFENVYEAMVRLNLPVYFRARQGAGIREKAADLNGARETFSQTQSRIRREASDLQREIETSDRLLSLIEGGLLPQARLTFESARASYSVGRSDFQTLLTIVTTLFEDEIVALELQFRYQSALAGMEALTGLNLIRPGESLP